VLLFGLTGGIASGKSSVAARLRERGVPVIDADRVAREVVEIGTPGLAALVEAFGDSILLPDGALDRKALAARTFGDEPARRRLNAILHPRIAARTAEIAAALAGEGQKLACYEAALLVENGVADAFRPLVLVAAPEDVQIRRAMARDGMTEADARARIASQTPLADKRKVADHVIENDGDREALNARTDEVLDAIRRAAGISGEGAVGGAVR
jgi:dephospho-CoA kinase